MANSSPSRRRQRSVRVSVATALLLVATVVVLLALTTRSLGWLSVVSVSSLVCGAAAARIIYNELLQSRREAALDRAEQARSYQKLFARRASEHAALTTAMTDQVASRDRSIGVLEVDLLLAGRRVSEAGDRVKREARRANEAMELVAELQVALATRRAEEADELASWESARADDERDGTVVDLLTWEERTTASGAARQAMSARKLA